jgi:hypothetical protein
VYKRQDTENTKTILDKAALMIGKKRRTTPEVVRLGLAWDLGVLNRQINSTPCTPEKESSPSTYTESP